MRASAPFVVVNNTSTAAARAELSAAGWVCTDADDVDPVGRCFDGYGVQVTGGGTARWCRREEVQPGLDGALNRATIQLAEDGAGERRCSQGWCAGGWVGGWWWCGMGPRGPRAGGAEIGEQGSCTGVVGVVREV